MDKLVKKHIKIISEFVDATYDLLSEIEKSRGKDQIPIEGFLTSLNECVANASTLYYSVKLMKYLDERADDSEQKISPDDTTTDASHGMMQPYSM